MLLCKQELSLPPTPGMEGAPVMRLKGIRGALQITSMLIFCSFEWMFAVILVTIAGFQVPHGIFKNTRGVLEGGGGSRNKFLWNAAACLGVIRNKVVV